MLNIIIVVVAAVVLAFMFHSRVTKNNAWRATLTPLSSDTILAEAAELDVDEIVVGSHGHGAMYRLLVGSISEGVLQRSSKPALVILPIHER